MTIHAYILLVDRPNGWRTRKTEEVIQNLQDYLRTDLPLPTAFVAKGSLVEYDPLCFDSQGHRSINVINLEDPEVKVSVLMKELRPLEPHQYELLLPLTPSQRIDLIADSRWRSTVLEVKVGDTVWFYRSSKAASVAAKSRINGNFGHVSNASREKDVGFVRYVGQIKGRKGFWIGVELFLDPNRGENNGTFLGHKYFEAEEYSSVFTTVNHLYVYDEDEDIEQIKQKIHKIGTKLNKRQMKTQFEKDKQLNQEKSQKMFGGERVEKIVNIDTTVLRLHDKIVWLSDYGPEYGVVKWIGHLPENDTSKNELVAGIEFDRPVGTGAGYYNNQHYFHAKQGHGSFVPLCGLLKAEDFDSNNGSTKFIDEIELKRRSNSHQERLADYKMRQKFKNSTSLSPENSSSRTGDNLSPSILGSIENEVNWTPSSQQSSPPRTQKERKNDLSLIQEDDQHDVVQDFSVKAQVHEKEAQIELPKFQKLSDAEENQLEEGTLVQLHTENPQDLPFYGVIQWIGNLTNSPGKKMAGVELEEELPGATNGWHDGSQYFACPDRKAIFVPLTHLIPDARFENGNSGQNGHNSPYFENGNGSQNGEFGEMECPVVPGFHCPIKTDDLVQFCGRNRGIQGHQNSCYLDATLFVMFSFTSVFDCLLYRPPNTQDINEYSEVQRVLREEIVNPLRKNWFVRADRVMKLRQLLDSLTSVRGLMSEEKDPEELLNSLLSQTLKASPFLELSSGQNAHLYQLFVERDESKILPSVQELFEQSFLTSGVKLKRVPSVLILQMPRFGRQFKVYDRILPSQILDVTDVIEDAPRQCIVCGKLAGWECAECYGDHGEGLDSTAFCETCLTRVHNHMKRRKHKMNQLKVPQEYFALQGSANSGGNNPRLYMELFAVMCIETSHYVSFVKCGLGPDAPWCFFDSMADRKGEKHGYNIPEVKAVPHVAHWLSEDGVKLLSKCPDDKMLPDYAKRLICDGYMCFYQSPQVMMYQ